MNCTYLRRAALIGAALLGLKYSTLVSAETKSKRAETAKDLIEKAYNLSLQKDRSQAITILVNAIKQESPQSENALELKNALQQVSYLFYSDRAQQTYELALSLRKTDPSQALQKINEALRVESDNLTLFNEAQRMLLIRGDCSTAHENVIKERTQNPYDENLLLLKAQALACLKKWDEVENLRRGMEDRKKTDLQKYWLALDIERSYQSKNYLKAKDHLAALQKLDPLYPELLYWQWRISGAGKNDTFGQKYINYCKNISATAYRQYMTDVNLCRKVSEVESATKKINGNDE